MILNVEFENYSKTKIEFVCDTIINGADFLLDWRFSHPYDIYVQIWN